MNLKVLSENKISVAKAAIFSILGAVGGSLIIKDAGAAVIPLYALFFIVMVLLVIPEYLTVRVMNADGSKSRKLSAYGLVYGSLFGIATDMGYQYRAMEMTAPGLKGKALIILAGICFSFLIFPVTYRIFRFIAGLYVRKNKKEIRQLKSGIAFAISLGVIQLCWLPVFLAFYPAIFSYDFNRQFGEAVRGYEWFYEYQPLAHTFLIRVFYLLGVRLGNVGTGMACFAFLQSLLLATAISAGLVYIYKKSGKGPWILWLVCFALLPFNPVLAVSMTKDILFSAFFVMAILLVIKLQEELSPIYAVLFLLIGVLNILFRNNASYAMIFLVPAFLFTGKDVKKKILCALLMIITVVAGTVGKTQIRNVMNAIPGPEMEKYSVPIMQMVRVSAYQDGNLSQEQRGILEKYLTSETWGEYYPYIADSAKSDISQYNSDNWLNDKKTLLKDYVKLGLAYPNDYLDAFLGLTIGYWSIGDRSHAQMLDVGDDSGYGLLFTFNGSANPAYPEGIPYDSKIPSLRQKYCHMINGNSYYNWPVVTLLMRPAFYFWLFVLAVFAAVYKRSRKSIAVFAYPFFYMLTMLLGPCVNFRYMYPYVIAVPVLIAFLVGEKKTSEQGTEIREGSR